ncbi:hypothetical protein KBC79_02585 [Candidatus Woesebacteria bacterium]|nr:hypothetical protein [Candidatus Woesebacteria bacterium]
MTKSQKVQRKLQDMVAKTVHGNRLLIKAGVLALASPIIAVVLFHAHPWLQISVGVIVVLGLALLLNPYFRRHMR